MRCKKHKKTIEVSHGKIILEFHVDNCPYCEINQLQQQLAEAGRETGRLCEGVRLVASKARKFLYGTPNDNSHLQISVDRGNKPNHRSFK